MTVYLKQAGIVEFKYRKDSKYTYTVNGIFKLMINDVDVMMDYNYTRSDWVIY